MTSEMEEINQEDSQEFDIDCLFQSTMKKEWDKVLIAYQRIPSACKAKLTKSEDTALHIAVSSYNADVKDAKKHAEIVKKLVDTLPNQEAVEILGMKNNKGNTPLHLAAALGSVIICECIASRGLELIRKRNLKNETPLFLAAKYGKLEAFMYLHKLVNGTTGQEPDESLCRRKDGYNVLHVAISGEYFKLAYQIIRYYPRLVNSVDEEGFSPLHILARKPNVFQSSSNFRLCDRIVYNCLIVRELKKKKFEPESQMTNYNFESSNHFPENYQTCMNFMKKSWSAIRFIAASLRMQNGSSTHQVDPLRRIEESPEEDKDEGLFPPNYATCIQLWKLAMNFMLIILGVGLIKLRRRKKKHAWALQVLNELLKYEKNYKYGHNGRMPTKNMELKYPERIMPPDKPPESDGQDIYSSAEETTRGSSKIKDEEEKEENKPVKEDTHILIAAKMKETQTLNKFHDVLPDAIHDLDPQKSFVVLRYKRKKVKDAKKETPILVAARMGITEMVETILKTFPVAIQDLDANGKNALLLAVEYRQTKVYDLLMQKQLPEFVLYQVDHEGNTALHLAATFQEHQPWRIPGTALQMQWEMKWYKHVKHSVPSQYLVHFKYNKNGETARQIFKRTHKKLVKGGSEWIIKTSESCSLVAALIATVAFATSTSVPGGVNEDTGSPVLQNQPAFELFSITSLVALCFSVTALIFFLAILTSRCQEKDFRGNLPTKLLVGLSSLFTSIAAILISFCAGHFFVLKGELHNLAFLMYGMTCLPITFFASAQLPLYFDLLWSTFKRVPLHSYKVSYHS